MAQHRPLACSTREPRTIGKQPQPARKLTDRKTAVRRRLTFCAIWNSDMKHWIEEEKTTPPKQAAIQKMYHLMGACPRRSSNVLVAGPPGDLSASTEFEPRVVYQRRCGGDAAQHLVRIGARFRVRLGLTLT